MFKFLKKLFVGEFPVFKNNIPAPPKPERKGNGASRIDFEVDTRSEDVKKRDSLVKAEAKLTHAPCRLRSSGAVAAKCQRQQSCPGQSP